MMNTAEMRRGVRHRFGMQRVERPVDPTFDKQLYKLKVVQDYVSSELLEPPLLRELAGNAGLTLSIIPSFKFALAIRNAGRDAPINDFSRFCLREVFDDVCEPFKDGIHADIAGVNVVQSKKDTNTANVYLDLSLDHSQSGAAAAYDRLALLTEYDGLMLPRTSHVRIMSVSAIECDVAKVVTEEALTEANLTSLAFMGLRNRTV